MADTIRVKAVPGIVCPHQGRRGFVGYETVRNGESADHEVPGGLRFRVMADGQEVPNTAHYRRAIERGDIAKFEAPVVRKNALKEIG